MGTLHWHHVNLWPINQFNGVCVCVFRTRTCTMQTMIMTIIITQWSWCSHSHHHLHYHIFYFDLLCTVSLFMFDVQFFHKAKMHFAIQKENISFCSPHASNGFLLSKFHLEMSITWLNCHITDSKLTDYKQQFFWCNVQWDAFFGRCTKEKRLCS